MHDQNQREVADSNRLQSTLEGEEEHESIEGTNVNTKRYWNRRRKYAPFLTYTRNKDIKEYSRKDLVCRDDTRTTTTRAETIGKFVSVQQNQKRRSFGSVWLPRRGTKVVCRKEDDGQAVKEWYKEYIGMVKSYYEGTQRSRQERPGEVAENSSGTAGIERPQAFAGLSVEIVGTPEDGTPRKTARDDVKMEGNKDEKNTERVTGFCGRGLGIRDKRKQQRETSKDLEGKRHQGRWKKIMHDQNQREVADSNRLQSTLEGEEEHESIEGTNVNTKRYWNRRRKYAPFWLRKRAGIEDFVETGVHRHGEYYEGTQRSRQERPGEVAENSSGTAGIERPQAFAGLSVEVEDTLDGTPRKTARDDVKMEGNKYEKNTERVTGFFGRGLGIRDKRKQQRETFGCLEQNREQ
ncbi:hypothetical protein Tco_1339105 [Tanacetum coccineum]